MFAPQGYVHWIEIKDDLFRVVQDTFRSSSHLKGATHSREYIAKFYHRIRDNAWYAFLEDCPSIGLASVEGKCVRFSGFDMGLRPNEPTVSDTPQREFLFIDNDTGLIDVSNVAKRISAAEELLAINSEEEATDDNPPSLTEEEWSDLCLMIDAKKYFPLLSKFDGWAVCCMREHRPGKVLARFAEEHADYLPKFEEAPNPIDYSEYLAKSGGKKSSLMITREIITLFDAGENSTKEEFRQKVCPNVSHRHFKRAWERATEERPALKLPGRRPAK